MEKKTYIVVTEAAIACQPFLSRALRRDGASLSWHRGRCLLLFVLVVDKQAFP
jgi:hypothetical protein